MRGVKLCEVGAALGVLALFAVAVGNSERVGLAQADCTVTVRPGQSIQQAIEQAAAGAVICLSAGTFQENIEIKKSLTLRGTGRERTIIKSKEDGEPVFDLALIDIQTEDEITVVLGRLTVTGAKGASGVVGVRVGGKANVTVSDSQVFDNGYGLLVMGSATVNLTDSQVSGSKLVGLSVLGQARVTLQYSQVSDNYVRPLRVPVPAILGAIRRLLRSSDPPERHCL